MHRARFELALERLKSSDWAAFEALASQFLAAEDLNLRTVASPGGDKGRDAELYVAEGDTTAVFQYSVTENWSEKIQRTARRIAKAFPNVKVLVYVTNQLIGAKADKIRGKLRTIDRLHLDVRDRTWFLDRMNLDPAREIAAQSLAQAIVDPYLQSQAVIETKGQALSSLESRCALVYLTLQWEDDIREKGLTKTAFEAFTRAALRHTDSEHRMTRPQVQTAVAAFLPNHPKEQLRGHVDTALNRLVKKSVRYWRESDEFCLSNEERRQQSERLANLEHEDLALNEEISGLVKRLISFEAFAQATPRVRRILEKFLLNKGETFVSALRNGYSQSIGFESLPEIIREDLAAHKVGNKCANAEPEISASVREIIKAPSATIQRYVRGIADAYTLLAFLHETPDVQSVTAKMFSHGEIWLDTTLLLPIFAETLVDAENRVFTNMLKAARESGLALRVTAGVIEEVERHMNRSLICSQRSGNWQGTLPFLFSVYTMSGRATASFSSWLELFRGHRRPQDDIAEYLAAEIQIKIGSLKEFAALASVELRGAVQEAWHAGHEARRHAELDNITTLRLVGHDVENYLGVIMKRRGEEATPFGYKHWWLTLDSIAMKAHLDVGRRLDAHPPDPPVMSADFLLNYLAFGPIRGKVSKASELALPITLDAGLLEFLPPELLAVANRVREQSSNLPEYLIRRKVRDSLDEAKRRIGPVAAGGIPDVERRIKADTGG
jgi:hypothetical protein